MTFSCDYKQASILHCVVLHRASFLSSCNLVFSRTSNLREDRRWKTFCFIHDTLSLLQYPTNYMYLSCIHYERILHRSINTVDGYIWELSWRLTTSVIKTITEKIKQKSRNLLRQLTLWLYLMHPQIIVHKNYIYVNISKNKKSVISANMLWCIISILERKKREWTKEIFEEITDKNFQN